MSLVKDAIKRLLGAFDEEPRFHRTFIDELVRKRHLPSEGLLLDVGARDGAFTRQLLERWAHHAGGEGQLQGVVMDVSAAYLARGAGALPGVLADAERSDWPFSSGSVAVVILNQVLEHVADPFQLLGEADRVLRVGGRLILGVPNLGGLVNRLYLLCGRQPPAIHFPGPHVRGFTFGALRRFVASNPNLRLVHAFGACAYPFPPPLSEWVGRACPSVASYMFFVLEKRADRRPSPWLDGRAVTGETVFRA